MASFHLCVHPNVSRGKGQSLVRTAAYNARARLVDERTGETWDYGRKGGLLAEAIYAPKDAPDWSRDLMRLVNEIERSERRGDAQLAMNLDIALPHELTLEQNRRLMGDFVREEFSRHGYVAHFAIHAPDYEGDERNIHAHVLVGLRKLGPDGFAKTKTEQQDRYRNRAEYVEQLREKWERLGNRHLERAGHAPSLDRRSLRERGIDREPEQHRGPKIIGMEREGKPTRIGDEIRQRQILDAERRQLGDELRQVDAQIIDLAAERAMREARAAARGATDDVRAGKDSRQRLAGDHGRETRTPAGGVSQVPEIARTAAEIEQTAAHAAARMGKALGDTLSRIAKPLEGIAEALGDMVAPTAPPTPEEAEGIERAADEAAEARARAEPQQAWDAARGRAIDENVRQQQNEQTQRYSRFGVIRPVEQPREQGQEQEIDRER